MAGRIRRLLGIRIRARWLLVIVPAGYLLFATAVWFGADSLIFKPHHSGYRDTADIIKLTTSDGERISAVYRRVPNAVYTVLIAHGNAEDLSDLATRTQFVNGLGLDAFAFDYHGYGTSQGSPSEANTSRDIQSAYDYLTNTAHVTPQRIIVLGRSLGAAVALDLAVHRPVGGLILESSFTTAFRVMVPFPIVPFDEFDNLAKIGKVRCPIAVAHGTADNVIPASQGRELFAKARTAKLSLWVTGAGHDNVLEVGRADYGALIERLIGLIERQSP